MSNKERFFYMSANQLIKIRGVSWIPDGNIRGILQIVHGMSEYIERYEDFALYLRERGILVTGNDHLGHGRSVITPDDYGFFAEQEGNRVLLEDMMELTRRTKAAYPNIPYFILGHSMGSFLTRQYLCEYNNEADGAVIMGTGSKPELILKGGMFLAEVMSIFRGWRYRSKLLDHISFSGYNKRFEPVRTKSDWLTKDEKIVDSYSSDSDSGFIFTLNGFHSMFYSISQAQKRKNLKKMKKELPVFFVAGEEDPVGDYGKGVLRVVKKFQDVGMKQVEYKLYPEDRHEILNELDKDKVYEDIYNWIERELSKNAVK